MTKIRQTAFSHRIEEYLHNPGSFDQQRFDSSLYRLVRQNNHQTKTANTPLKAHSVIRGLSFSDHIGLVMLLIERAYRSLVAQTDARTFSRAIAKALQTYADPIVDGDYACFPYPYFLMHGLDKQTERTSASLRKTAGLFMKLWPPGQGLWKIRRSALSKEEY